MTYKLILGRSNSHMYIDADEHLQAGDVITVRTVKYKVDRIEFGLKTNNSVERLILVRVALLTPLD